MQIIVQSLATNYERLGKGRQLLILHGWADDSRSWRSFARELSKSYDVIIPDLPGFGGTEAPHEVWGLADYAQFIADLVSKLELAPYAVIGHSNGGALALKVISQGKLHPEKLVLLASAGIRDEGKTRKRALRLLAKTGKAATMPLPSSVRNQLRRKLYQAAGSDMLVAEHLQETFKRVVGEDMREDAGHITIPALLIYGSEDMSTPPRYGEQLAGRMGNARLETIPGAGHFIHSDAMSTVVTLVEEFLR